ncbi:MAG: hypothetical protein AAFY15_07455 [Cyanobacteria bacterium J06648_11]
MESAGYRVELESKKEQYIVYKDRKAVGWFYWNTYAQMWIGSNPWMAYQLQSARVSIRSAMEAIA